MATVEPRVLKGFRDYPPSKMIPRRRMLARIEDTFESFGFVPLMTPALEYLDVLTGKYGDEGENLLYRFRDQGERDVALRYDLTVPLARVVAMNYPDITLPFRRYQIAPVWRAEKPARGRFREFVQCDADIVGSRSMVADAELIQLALELLRGLGIEGFQVRVNNRKVLSGLMEALGVPSGPLEMGILRTIDKLPKIGEEATARLLADENGLDPERVARIFSFLGISGSPREMLERLGTEFGESSPARAGRDELADVFRILEGSGETGEVAIDLSIARGLNYYTGTIYEVFLTGLPGFGAVMAGGRYDGLIGVFKGEEIPAVGISLGIDRLLEGLIEMKLLDEASGVASVLVTVFDAATAPYAAKAAKDLRSEGIACELYPSEGKLKKQFALASSRPGLRWAVVAGPDEVSKQEVKVKDLASRTEESVPLAGLARYLREKGAGRPGAGDRAQPPSGSSP